MATTTEPGIDIRRLKPGTILLLEADPFLYEIKVVYPVHSIIEISSSDPCLRTATMGQLLHGILQQHYHAVQPAGFGVEVELRWMIAHIRTRRRTNGCHLRASRLRWRP